MDHKIAVITDSSALISSEQKAKYPHLYVIPLVLIRSNGAELVDDLTKTNTKLFYEYLAKEPITTSQIALGVMQKYWKQLLETYEQIIFLGLSKGISSQHPTMVALAKEPEFRGKVFVLDTETCAWPLNFLVMQTLEQLDLFQRDYAAFMTLFAQWQKQTDSYLILESLETLKQGGRISPSVATLAKMTKIMPILKFEAGSLVKFAKTRTMRGGCLKIVATVPKNQLKHYDCHLLLTNQPSSKVQLLQECLAKYPFRKVLLNSLPKVVAAHTGAQAVGIVLYHYPLNP